MRIRLEERILEDEGYRRVYHPEPDPATVPSQKSRLRRLKPGDHFTPRRVQVVRQGMDEARLIRALEERGIGRPSTYALVVKRLVEHGYVRRRADGALEVTDLGREVLAALSQAYPSLLSYAFTAEMERKLNALAVGKIAYTTAVQKVWSLFQEGSDA